MLTKREAELRQHESKVRQLFKDYRDYVKHEALLISQRMQRMLLLQGALFTAAGTSVVRASEPGNSGWTTTFWCASMFLITVLGEITAGFSYSALRGACTATDEIKRRWKVANDAWVNQNLPTAEDLHLPPITGGGSAEAERLGVQHVYALPKILMAVVWPIFGLLGLAMIVSGGNRYREILDLFHHVL